MKQLFPLLSLLFLGFAAFAQQPIVDTDEVFMIAEVSPKFPGGKVSLMAYLSSTPYPANASANNVEGTAYIKFIVEKDGSISTVSVARSSNNEELDLAAVHQVQNSPKWKPGMQRGKAVRVEYIVPIRFKTN